MSYLQLPRLAFAGRFQADVSTVNNDPRHFDNSNFDPAFQDFSDGDQMNGWWNPVGTGIFRFDGCAVRSLVGADGRVLTAQRDDPACGLLVGNALARPSAKLVDLDPDWQLASCPYGLGVSLTTTAGRVLMQADYQSNPFRDLWFGRCSGKGDSAASAMFQSVLTHVEWNLDGFDSPFFERLRAACADGLLSIRLTTYGYATDSTDPQFGYGTLIGAIGPASAGEPRSFVRGRRFMPTTQNSGVADMASSNNIGPFSAQIDAAGATLQADLSNALPLGAGYAIAPIAGLRFALLTNALTAQDSSVGPDDYIALDPVDQSDALQTLQAGIQQVALPEVVRAAMGELPFALLRGPDPDGRMVVELREALLGLELRPDTFAIRLDPNDAAGNHAGITFYATRYGRPLADVALAFWPSAPALDIGNTPVSAGGSTPKALLPVNNVPSAVLQLNPAHARTDAGGKVDVCLQGPPSMGTPREYMDGQLYTVSYNFAGPDPALQHNFDKLAVVVFSTLAPCAAPAWSDVQPILQQYANLYPVMSQGLFDFSQQEQADANAFLLRFVFDKGIDDPDQMPVTRDLSSARRALLIRYFDQVLAERGRPANPLAMFGNRCPTRGGAALRAQAERAPQAGAGLPGKSRGPNP